MIDPEINERANREVFEANELARFALRMNTGVWPRVRPAALSPHFDAPVLPPRLARELREWALACQEQEDIPPGSLSWMLDGHNTGQVRFDLSAFNAAEARRQGRTAQPSRPFRTIGAISLQPASRNGATGQPGTAHKHAPAPVTRPRKDDIVERRARAALDDDLAAFNDKYPTTPISAVTVSGLASYLKVDRQKYYRLVARLGTTEKTLDYLQRRLREIRGRSA